ncbi:hypothetical protein INT46_006171 [Mucor plumbeus]|uniref:Tc1-like transposase DDE domain-containing protein n=1 Tax=Mucor plumbeus TaxID=97098 RepID=A0A8H7R1N2_9FUNG|nr:hypothetical protein INT46_006171 [Mucor plumbeus]
MAAEGWLDGFDVKVTPGSMVVTSYKVKWQHLDRPPRGVAGNVLIERLTIYLQDTMAYYGFDKKTFSFQQDNARPHTSGATKRWFRHHGYSLDTVLDWPAQSPDLNPIEHVWHQLKLRLNKYPTRATTISELEEGIEREWYKFTKENCLKYIDSMPRRINAVIRSRGGPTRYQAFLTLNKIHI